MAKQGYTVEVQTGPLDYLGDELLERLAKMLSADRRLAGPVAAGNTLSRVISVRTGLDATRAEDAVAIAITRIRLALRRAGAGDAEIGDFSVMRDLPEDEYASARDDVVGTPDVARRLGISRQRVAQLVDQPGRFPHPIATVRGTNVWRWGDIADWVAAGARDMRRKKTTAAGAKPKRARTAAA